MPIVSKSEYAGLRGCSPAYISKLLREGKIREIAEGEHKGKIDSELADRQLEAARDPVKDGVRRRWEREKSGSSGQRDLLQPQEEAGAQDRGAPPKPEGGTGSAAAEGYYAHKAKREKYEAKLSELKFLEQVGRLVAAEDIEREFETIARSVRDALLNIPDRVAPILAAETNPARVHALIAEEIGVALHDLSRRLEGTGAAAGGTEDRPVTH